MFDPNETVILPLSTIWGVTYDESTESFEERIIATVSSKETARLVIVDS